MDNELFAKWVEALTSNVAVVVYIVILLAAILFFAISVLVYEGKFSALNDKTQEIQISTDPTGQKKPEKVNEKESQIEINQRFRSMI